MAVARYHHNHQQDIETRKILFNLELSRLEDMLTSPMVPDHEKEKILASMDQLLEDCRKRALNRSGMNGHGEEASE